MAGYYPFTGVLGHEFVGIVEQGPDSDPWDWGARLSKDETEEVGVPTTYEARDLAP
jgi:threonine dehydrogenase-like Zn-dependent dehydrogenase